MMFARLTPACSRRPRAGAAARRTLGHTATRMPPVISLSDSIEAEEVVSLYKANAWSSVRMVTSWSIFPTCWCIRAISGRA